MGDKERRLLTTELRMETNADGSAKLVGYAAVFNSESEDLGGFREIVKPGAFKRAIDEGQDVRALLNHDSNNVLGRTKSGTLTLTEDNTGLRYEVDLPDTQTARDLQVSIKRGDINQSSFGFMVREESWARPDYEAGRPYPIRYLHDVDLFDVSPVTFPAYTATSVGVSARSMAEKLTERAQTSDRPAQTIDETEIARANNYRARQLNLLKSI